MNLQVPQELRRFKITHEMFHADTCVNIMMNLQVPQELRGFKITHEMVHADM
jgi:Zn-dependent peptidase ImmA (M78 family)